MSPSQQFVSQEQGQRPVQLGTQTTIHLTPFDQKAYRSLIEARGQSIRRVLKKLKSSLSVSSALDTGCGVGFFSQILADHGLSVRGFDGRAENVAEAKRRFPDLPFEVGDIQDRSILQLGRFDLVLCFGLLYHLENPFAAIRNLYALTEKCLLLESMRLPDEKLILTLREEPSQDDQSLSDVAWYPTESSLVKMLYRAGFPFVYRIIPLPDHEDFRETQEHFRRRTLLLGSSLPMDVAGFRLIPEPLVMNDPWAKQPAKSRVWAQRIRRFLASPARKKYVTLATRARRIFPSLPIPLRLPFGAWWLAENSSLDQELIYNGFELTEMEFTGRLLHRGMTVVDAGAHHGLYTVLASKRVGRDGKVIAIEPSPRECLRLEKHLQLNRCSNVTLVRCAAGADPGEEKFYVVERFRDSFNSLRPPAIEDPFITVQVQVRRLDDILAELQISRVDFIKLDVEGGELPVLQGALKLLNRSSRPAMLVEVQDIRTAPWGYPAREIVRFLMRLLYQWFSIGPKGALLPINCDQEHYDANLVALPAERLSEFLSLLAGK